MGEITWQPGMTLEALEKLVIMKALSFYGLKSSTAQALGISIRTLQNKLNLYEGKPPEPEEIPKSKSQQRKEVMNGESKAR